MKGSIVIARLFGIPVQLHWSFFLLIAYLLMQGVLQSWDLPSYVFSLGFLIALFTCVVLHEFGHALTARRFGVQTRDIILSPIGGVARLDKLPEKPLQEFLVAVAGPLVNVAIALLLAPYLLKFSPDLRYQLIQSVSRPSSNYFRPDLPMLDYFVVGIIGLNIILAIFNMLPAFPMDGGRVLRALLSLKLSRLLATRIASLVGQGLAGVLLVYGIFIEYNLIYAFIAVFIFLTASGEYRMVRSEVLLGRHTVRELLQPQIMHLRPDDPVAKAINRYGREENRNFLVQDDWHNLLGILPEGRIMAAYKERRLERSVREFMQRDFVSAHDGESLKEVYHRMQRNEQPVVPVFNQHGGVAGTIDHQAIETFLQQQSKAAPARFRLLGLPY